MLNAPQWHAHYEIIDLLSCAAGRLIILPFHNTRHVHSRVSVSVSVTVLAATHLVYTNKEFQDIALCGFLEILRTKGLAKFTDHAPLPSLLLGKLSVDKKQTVMSTLVCRASNSSYNPTGHIEKSYNGIFLC